MLSLLVYPYFELAIEQDTLLSKKPTGKLNDFTPFCRFLAFQSNCPGGGGGVSIRQRVLLERDV